MNSAVFVLFSWSFSDHLSAGYSLFVIRSPSILTVVAATQADRGVVSGHDTGIFCDLLIDRCAETSVKVGRLAAAAAAICL